MSSRTTDDQRSPQSHSLGALADPTRFTERVKLDEIQRDGAFQMLRTMCLIRFVEEEIAALVEQGIAKCPCHLAIGQEATAVGVFSALERTDCAFGNHRSHAHYLAAGGDVDQLFAEVLGKASGCSHGMGGSMHLRAPESGFLGSVPIVGGTIPIAVGAALAVKKRGERRLAIAFFGDGTTEEGIFHESLNFAANYSLPVLFVCENNFYSSHLDIKLRQPFDSVGRFADAHGMPRETVDGNDVCEVSRVTKEIIRSMRADLHPAFLELVTYRWRGHVGPNEDIDVGVRRHLDDLRLWRRRDPVRRLRESIIAENIATEEEIEAMAEELRDQIRTGRERGLAASYPGTNQLLDVVYA